MSKGREGREGPTKRLPLIMTERLPPTMTKVPRHLFSAATALTIAVLLFWVDIVGWAQAALWLYGKFGIKGFAFSAMLRWNFLPAWAVADAMMASATLDTSDFYAFDPSAGVTAATSSGLLFLPGALVHPHAYAPILSRLANESGVLCVCVKPRFRMSALWSSNPERALGIFHQFPRIRKWTLAGHSMGAGGYGAANLASHLLARGTQLDGLIMWAGAITSGTNVDLSRSTLRTLAIFGSEDSIAPFNGKAEDGSLIRDNLRRYNSPHTKLIVVQGGNHDGFGHYGPQTFPRLDNPRKISHEAQQAQVTRHSAQFLRGGFLGIGRY